MARGRMLDRSIKLSKKIAKTSRDGQWLYFRMLPFTDDHGKTFGDAEDIHAEILPKEKISLRKIETLLNELHLHDLVKWDKNLVTVFVDWSSHQSLKGRPANSQFPDYQEVTGKDQERSGKVEKDSERIASLSSLPFSSKNKDRGSGGKEKIYRKIQHLELTQPEYDKLIAVYSASDIGDILDDMENWGKLNTKKSAYLTALKWLKKRESDQTRNTYRSTMED